MLVQQFYENKKSHDFLHSNFILYQATRGVGEGDAVYERFGIRATPTVMVLGSDGSEIDWHVGYGPPPEKFLERVEKSAKIVHNRRKNHRKAKKVPNLFEKNAKNSRWCLHACTFA